MRYWILSLFAAFLVLGQDQPISSEDVVPTYFEQMDYPLGARFTHTQGVVVVRTRFDGEGKPVSAEALSGAKALATECVGNAKKWRFRANGSNGSAIIVYEFRIEGLCHSPCPSQFLFKPPNLAVITIGDAVVETEAGRSAVVPGRR